jgi:uncharacterized protein YndB with AHSA1/START domain
MPHSSNTVHLHRVLKSSPERIYKAFLDPDAMAKWLPPYGFTCAIHHMDVKVGGTYRMSFKNFPAGNGHSFGGKYLELLPNQCIRYSDSFDDPNLPGEMQTTVSLKKVSCGTELSVVQEGIARAIPFNRDILLAPILGGDEDIAERKTGQRWCDLEDARA